MAGLLSADPLTCYHCAAVPQALPKFPEGKRSLPKDLQYVQEQELLVQLRDLYLGPALQSTELLLTICKNR